MESLESSVVSRRCFSSYFLKLCGSIFTCSELQVVLFALSSVASPGVQTSPVEALSRSDVD